MATQMSTASVTKAYDRWSPVYDLVFGPVFKKGRSAAIVAAAQESVRTGQPVALAG